MLRSARGPTRRGNRNEARRTRAARRPPAQEVRGSRPGACSRRAQVAGRARQPHVVRGHLGGSLNAQCVTSNFLLLSGYKMTSTGAPGTTAARRGDTQGGSTSGGVAQARPLTARACAQGAGSRGARGLPRPVRGVLRAAGVPAPGLKPRDPRALRDPPATLSGSSGENARHSRGWQSIWPRGPGSAR